MPKIKLDLHNLEEGILNDPEFEKHKKVPIYKKSLVIRKLTKAVVSPIDDENDEFNLKQLMLENAYMISSKIAGAEAGELYSYRLENAFSIKRYANELMAECILCETKGLGNQEYIVPLREKIEELRVLFHKWVDSFNKAKDLDDPWALWQDYGGE